MKEVIATVMTATEGLAHEKRLALRAILPATLPAGEGDERRITQVLLNLVGNALKFTEVGEVKVRASAENGCFELSFCLIPSGKCADSNVISAGSIWHDALQPLEMGGTAMTVQITWLEHDAEFVSRACRGRFRSACGAPASGACSGAGRS